MTLIRTAPNPRSHAAVSLGRKLFPLFALALDLPENFFDDKVWRSFMSAARVARLLMWRRRNIDQERRCAHARAALPTADGSS